MLGLRQRKSLDMGRSDLIQKEHFVAERSKRL